MDVQIESMYKKANKKLGMMSRIRRFISTNTAVKMYKTMITPHLEYVDFIVESGSKIAVSKFTRLQERALTPSTLDSCSYRFKMYLIAENMPIRMVKTVFKYSF